MLNSIPLLNISILLGTLIYLTAIISYINNSNIVLLLIYLELLLLAIIILFSYFSFLLDDIVGIIFSLALLSIAGVESVIGLTLCIKIYPISSSNAF